MYKLVLSLLFICVSFASVPVSIDFSKYIAYQLQGTDGGSFANFGGAPCWGNMCNDTNDTAGIIYSSIEGFPDEESDNSFKRFCDTAFTSNGPKGMALNSFMLSPTHLQTPPNSIGKNYSVSDFKNLKMDYYSPLTFPPNVYIYGGKYAQGQIVTLAQAALKRIRLENRTDVNFWVDLHYQYPRWILGQPETGNSNLVPFSPEQYWPECALHLVYFVKYLVSSVGVPIVAVSFTNEPNGIFSPAITPLVAARFMAVMRQKLDEAGLHGVRTIPGTWKPLEKVMDNISYKVSLNFLL
eukprot:TRINITY_DN5048_c0_g1_i3.p1 TRINITY_DN5048_c0_g1~~TRINITY_DN5048_c0_g1_i3.p1  ORF type:complete len:296 (+),score=39.45 TRINITY_DN5048_c0_g1_i3:38-925(+)